MANILTLEDLKNTTSVYNGFARIEDCSIPSYFKSVFPKTCRCGGEMIMTEPAHTQLQCCNPDCYVKMGYRLSYFISKLGYKGFGDQSSLTLITTGREFFKYPTFMSAFLLSETEINRCLTEHLADMFCEIRDDIHERSFNFVDAIAALGIPNIGSRSSFFDVVKSPVVLLHYLLQNKTDELCEACGIQASSTRYYLKSFKLDILTLMKDVMPHIKDTPKGEIYVAITGKVSVNGTQYSRQDFVELCESITDEHGVQQYKIVQTKAESKLQYVIADEPSSHSKYDLGRRLGILITAQDFYNQISRLAKSNNQVQEENTDE